MESTVIDNPFWGTIVPEVPPIVRYHAEVIDNTPLFAEIVFIPDEDA